MTTLCAVPFDASLLPLIQGFQCGIAPWQREVAEFLKAPLGREGAAQFVADREAFVWLFQTQDRQTVGYAALGEKVWPIPYPNGRKRRHPIQYLLFLGVKTEYQHQPPGPPQDRYAWRIMEEVMAIATDRLHADPQRLFPAVGGLVESGNEPAFKFARRFGYADLTPPDATGYHSMLYALPPLPGSPWEEWVRSWQQSRLASPPRSGEGNFGDTTRK